MARIRRVLSLLVGLASSLQLNADHATIRKALLSLLNNALLAAAATPGIVDDLLIRAAIALVGSDSVWDWVLEYLRRRVLPISGEPFPVSQTADLSATSDADIETLMGDVVANFFHSQPAAGTANG